MNRAFALYLLGLLGFLLLQAPAHSQAPPEVLPADALKPIPLRSNQVAPPPRAFPGSHTAVPTLPASSGPLQILPRVRPRDEEENDEGEDTRQFVEMWNTRRSPEDFQALIDSALAMPGEPRRGDVTAQTAFGSVWTQLGNGIHNAPNSSGGHNRAGRIRAAAYAYDNNQDAAPLWLGSTGGGLWKAVAVLFFVFWVPVSDSLPGSPSVGAFLVQPGNSNNILIGTGDLFRYPGSGLFKTTDGGATWHLTSLSPAPSSFQRIVCDVSDPSNNTVLAQGNSGIWRSTDFGATWTQVYHGQVTDLAQDPVNTYIWYAGIPNVGIFRSRDNGHSFPSSANLADGDIAQGMGNNIGRVSLTVCASAPWFVYAITEGAESGATFGTLGGIWRSSDFGSNFTAIDDAVPDKLSGAQGFHACAISVDPTNPDRLFCGMGRMQWTESATANSPSWNKGLPIADGGHPDYTSFVFEPNSTNVVITNDGGCYFYDWFNDILSDPSNLLGLNCEQFFAISNSYDTPNLLLGGLQDNGIVEMDKDISGNMEYFIGGDGTWCSIQPDNNSVFFADFGAPFSRNYSTDGGASWNDIDNSLGGTPSGGPTLIDPRLGNTNPYLYTALYSFDNSTSPPTFLNASVCYKPIDTGTGWQAVGAPLPNGYKARLVDVAMDGFRDIIYVNGVSTGQVFAYEGAFGNMGAFDRTPPLPPFSSNSDCVINADKSGWQPDTVYYTTGLSRPSHAFYSTDRGQTWHDVTGDLTTKLPSANYYKLIANPGDLSQLYLATDVGVMRSDNGGVNWYRFMDGLPAVIEVKDLTINYDRISPALLHLGSNGRGLWERQAVADATLKGLTIFLPTVAGGLQDHGTVILDQPAGPSGAVVALSTDNPAVSVPTSVTVPSGATSADFNIATSVVAANNSGKVYATYHEVTQSALITVRPISVFSLSLAPAVVAGSLNVNGAVTLEEPAGPGDITVGLSSNSHVAGPTTSTIIIPAGSQSGAFTVATSAVTVKAQAIITASANGRSQGATLTVRPISVLSVVLSATKIKAGATVKGKVTLEASAAPGPITIKIASSNPKVALPSVSSITIAKGVSAGFFTIATSRKGVANTTVTIAATANGGTKTVKLNITP